MKNTWFQKLKTSLTKSSTVISEGITNIISSRRLDDETLQELEDLLIKADLGVDNSVSIIENLNKKLLHSQNIFPYLKHYHTSNLSQSVRKIRLSPTNH